VITHIVAASWSAELKLAVAILIAIGLATGIAVFVKYLIELLSIFKGMHRSCSANAIWISESSRHLLVHGAQVRNPAMTSLRSGVKKLR
jgi:fatty-acid desaturase